MDNQLVEVDQKYGEKEILLFIQFSVVKCMLL